MWGGYTGETISCQALCMSVVCPAGQLQAAMTAYKAALRDNPTDPLLYSNLAAVQLRLGNVNEVCRQKDWVGVRMHAMLASIPIAMLQGSQDGCVQGGG